jgi:hypothetical protein
MAGLLQHSPADILRHLLVAELLGTLPSAGQEWPVFSQLEPTRPDDCITTYDTADVRHGRLMNTGRTALHYGLQVRIRSARSPEGHRKANQITIGMEPIYQSTVTIDDSVYVVHSVNHSSGPVYIGREPDTARMLFTVNFLACIHQE